MMDRGRRYHAERSGRTWATYRGRVRRRRGLGRVAAHERAWRETLAELLGPDVAAPFTTVVYQERVAGRPRLAGARAVLDWLGIPDAEVRSIEYARRKQRRLEELIDAGDFTAFPDALRLVTALRARGFRLAAASSSRKPPRRRAPVEVSPKRRRGCSRWRTRCRATCSICGKRIRTLPPGRRATRRRPVELPRRRGRAGRGAGRQGRRHARDRDRPRG